MYQAGLLEANDKMNIALEREYSRWCNELR